MSNGIIVAIMQGRFGNCMFTYALARGYAERHGFQLQTGPWLGQQIFQLDDAPIEKELPLRTEFDVVPGEADIAFRSYAMSQKAIDWYTRRDAQRWFQLRPKITEVLPCVPNYCCAHLRHGDFLGLDGFVAVSRESYIRACGEYGINPTEMQFVQEEPQSRSAPAALPSDVAPFLPDFWLMMQARLLLRANSSFSWWAATLGKAESVFSPKLDGILAGSREPQAVPFVEGNWPAISTQHWFCSDLHLKP